jgi:phosphate uptake regulator
MYIGTEAGAVVTETMDDVSRLLLTIRDLERVADHAPTCVSERYI